MIRIDVVAADELPEPLLAAWAHVQDGWPELRHPMLAAAFVQAIARHRGGVRIAVIRAGERPVGFFPFQQDRPGTGYPVGYRINDQQGAVLPPDTDLDAARLLRGCGLRVWHFDHLIPSQRVFAGGHFLYEDAPYIDLSHGLDAYLDATASRGRWSSHRRKARRLADELGPVRFEFHTADAGGFDRLIAWKSEQVREHGRRCVFDWPWVRASLEELRASRDERCAGTLSALYAGDRLVAAHLGLRSREILHWWITAYDPALQRHSPGALLLIRVIEESVRRGVQRIDLGKGVEPYKTRFQSGALPLASGAVTRFAAGHLRQRATYALQERVRTSPLASSAKRLLYWLETRTNRG
jgi:CelD/BcsL family acetyltransferase involved in cellulose biosynthesis